MIERVTNNKNGDSIMINDFLAFASKNKSLAIDDIINLFIMSTNYEIDFERRIMLRTIFNAQERKR